MSSKASALKIEYINSIITSNELIESGLIYSPYTRFYDPTSHIDMQIVKVYVWMPYASTLSRWNRTEKIPVSIICDAGVQEIEGANLDYEFLSREIYRHPPGKLNDKKTEQFIDMMSHVLNNTFVISMLIPEVFLGGGQGEADLATSYQSLINLVLLPLVSSHSRNKFRSLYIYRDAWWEHDAKLASKITRTVRRAVKAGFKDKFYADNIIDQSDKKYFYIYSCRLLAYAAHRLYNLNDDKLLSQINEAFSQPI